MQDGERRRKHLVLFALIAQEPVKGQHTNNSTTSDTEQYVLTRYDNG